MGKKKYIDASKIRFSDLSNGLGLVWVTYKEWIDEMPAADVEQVKHGKWIKVPSATHKDIYFYDCSICKASIHSKTDSGLYSAIEWNGGINLCCPYCGAKMDGKEKEE